MGLDCYWSKTERAADGLFRQLDAVDGPRFDPPLQLCGGILSGNGQGSFRGKVYAQVILEETGVDLYRPVDPDECVKVADGLARWLPRYPSQEREDLIRMFRAYGEQGWWCLPWF